MNMAAIRLSAAFAGALLLAGCERKAGPTSTNPTFTVTRLPSTPDGRPVVDIKPLNKQLLPQGPAAASVRYILMVRRNGAGYYIRWFYANEVGDGLQRDLAIPSNEVAPGDKLTVSVEDVNPRDASDYVLLSNVLDLSLPAPAPPSTASPNSAK